MKSPQKSNLTTIALFSVIFILLDQLSKYLIKEYCPQLISRNYGIVFGIIENQFLVYLLILIGVVILIWLLSDNKSARKSVSIAIALITAGALSNLIDRLIDGYVVDFISLPYPLNWWPQFNLADIFILAGIIMYSIELFRQKQ